MARFVDKPFEIPQEHHEHAHGDEEQGRAAPHFQDGQSVTEFSTTTSEKAGSSKYASSTIGIEHAKASKGNERKLVRKLDVVILPLAALLYLAAYLDRITYIVLSVPGTLLAKQFLPSTTIAFGALTWSIAASCQAAVTNPAGLYVCRLFVGVGEACFGQAMAVYFTFFYTRKEIAKRIGLFISAGSLAGAFSGLIAYGVSNIKSSPIPQWRILFLIEGLPSLALAIVVFFCLPSRPEKTRYLNEEQRTVACTRLNADGAPTESTGIDWRAVRYTLLNWRTYVVAVAYSAMNLGLSSTSGYLPTIIKGLGYTNAKAQIMSVPPYAVSLVVMLLICTYSDRAQTRGIPIMCVFATGIVGWSILLGVSPVDPSSSDLKVRYFGCFCVVSAAYSAIPLIMSWQASNVAGESQKAVALGMLNSVGQCLSILGSFIFPKNEGPRYVKAASLNIAFQCLGLLISLSMTLYYRWENRRRDKREGGKPAKGLRIEGLHEDYDHAVGFRYTP
ncbi:hypothetical protein Rhopal_000682-T1 [Rhodotorula paludigena]|uniref:Uncharacterized protein n=1 Tax=Rhodotorula paludigena TaxID=86838 RepID=A0AAV5GF89_9BASI|nr:hypothetical protein Rhopal_000682-T1 [Rhodotorula paludigena]